MNVIVNRTNIFQYFNRYIILNIKNMVLGYQNNEIPRKNGCLMFFGQPKK